MTAFFVFSNSDNLSHAAPQLANLHFAVAEALGERYRVQTFSQEQELLDNLRETKQAVVLAPVTHQQLPPFLKACKDTLPTCSVIALLLEEPPQNKEDLNEILQLDCHWLSVNYDFFQLRAVLSSALRQANLLFQLSQGIYLDEVTTLLNRAFFMRRLEQEISLARRHLYGFCCVILGVDFYKLYLDSYGYQFVNGLLHFIGEHIVFKTRKEDLVARLSDDEIILLLPHTSEMGARTLAERIIANLNNTTFTQGKIQEAISVCAGLVHYPILDDTNVDADKMLRYGRHALYVARENEGLNGLPVKLFSEIEPAF